MLRNFKIFSLVTLALTLLNTSNVFATVEYLPEEVCNAMVKVIDTSNCLNTIEEDVHAQYIDLNADDTKELIFNYGGGSCGSDYWVFKLDEKMRWKTIGMWCGCEDGVFEVKKTRHNGFLDIRTCGISGFFDGKEYVGRRQ